MIYIDARINVKGTTLRTWICHSLDYRMPNTEVCSVQDFCSSRETSEQQLLAVLSAQELFQIYLVDFIVGNTDRHGNNTELILNPDGKIRRAPLFDHGSSLLYGIQSVEMVPYFNVMQVRDSNNYIGDYDLYKNLGHIIEPVSVNALYPLAYKRIVCGLSRAIPAAFLTASWDMIWRRYNYAKEKNFLIERSKEPTIHTSYFNS